MQPESEDNSDWTWELLVYAIQTAVFFTHLDSESRTECGDSGYHSEDE